MPCILRERDWRDTDHSGCAPAGGKRGQRASITAAGHAVPFRARWLHRRQRWRISTRTAESFVGKSVKPEYLTLRYGNRHGLVTGATGTGKTVTLQVLAEGFSRAGVSVFAVRYQGRSLRHCGGRRGQGTIRQTRQGARLRLSAGRISRDLLGPVRRAGPSGARHDLRDGAAAAGAPDGSERCPGRRAEHRVSRRRRARAAAARPQGPARHARVHRRARQRAHHAIRQRLEDRRSGRSSASCWYWRTRAAANSSPSRRST